MGEKAYEQHCYQAGRTQEVGCYQEGKQAGKGQVTPVAAGSKGCSQAVGTDIGKKSYGPDHGPASQDRHDQQDPVQAGQGKLG